MKAAFFFALAIFLSGSGISQEKPAKLAEFALKSGDTIVFVGNTFTERAQRYGHIETALELAAGPKVTGLKFRNLGWSGDSVFGDARSYFGAPKEGRDRLDKGINELKPSVVFLTYGTGAAMTPDQSWTLDPAEAPKLGSQDRLSVFKSGYAALIDRIRANAGDGLREVVLVSPPPLENLGAPLPDQTENNQRLAKYRDAIRDLAKEKNARFVDLFGAMGGDDFSGDVAEPPLTDNGIHYGEAGYEKIGQHLVEELGLKMPDGLVDETVQEKVDALRDTVVKKNRTFFHRWRPANETYLFLFRKHEQGNNAKEIPMFDPIVKKQEAKIGELRTAVFEAARKR
ncbi:MAG: SGNH/GDSL hydrolase family protein [Verrucomicrobiales bacterium]|nr:SGNH/GDSL hydrolase family protein [Verrucomicrobiales bacterium]